MKALVPDPQEQASHHLCYTAGSKWNKVVKILFVCLFVCLLDMLKHGLLENTGFILPVSVLKEIKLLSIDFGHKQCL